MLLPKESVQGRCWEDSVPEHFGPNWLETTPLHFPPQPKVFRDAAWQATSLNTCRELKSGVSFKAWWGNATRIQFPEKQLYIKVQMFLNCEHLHFFVKLFFLPGRVVGPKHFQKSNFA